MSIYEQAAERLSRETQGHWHLTKGEVFQAAAAVWDAIYTCPQCDGTGRTTEKLGGSTGVERSIVVCPAEHVLLSNPHNGEERHCRPEMAEWRCWSQRTERRVTRHPWHIDCNDRCGLVPVAYEGNNE